MRVLYVLTRKPPGERTSLLTQDLTRFWAMDFLKSAVASIAKGPAFPYSFGDRVDTDQSIWTLHNGTRRVGQAVRQCPGNKHAFN